MTWMVLCYNYPTKWESMYPYTADLMCLDFCHPLQSHNCRALQRVTTSLDPTAWEMAQHKHPDRAYLHLLTAGIREGFRIGFNWQSPLKSALSNMQSAQEHLDVIDTYLEKECSLGRMLGPFRREELANLTKYHINRFRVIPKGHDTGKWRLITDLSYPPGKCQRWDQP